MNFKKSFVAIAMSAMLSVGAVSAKDEPNIVNQVKSIASSYVIPGVTVSTLVKGAIGIIAKGAGWQAKDSNVVWFSENCLPGLRVEGEKGEQGILPIAGNVLFGGLGTVVFALNMVDLLGN